MTEEDRRKIISNDYADLLVEYKGGVDALEEFRDDTINIINYAYATIYFPVSKVSQKLQTEIGFSVIPKMFGLIDDTNLVDMGVRRVQNLPYLNLRGQGVLLGFVDTGIEYTNPLFLHANRTTRIKAIWDQSIENMEASEEIYYYGTEYSEEDINRALLNENPLSLVPSTDEDGHGTMIAGLAGGTSIPESNFEGVVTLAEYVIVKLKPPKQIIREYFSIPEDVIAFQENDIMYGVNYLIRFAKRLKRPIAICIALGSTQNAHDGRDSLSSDLNTLSDQTGVAIVTAAGNEGNTGHHYVGEINQSDGFDKVELKVGAGEKGLAMQIWGSSPGSYSIDILSPSGEYIPRIPARLGESRSINFLFENTTIFIDYLLIESQTGEQLISVRFINPQAGIWRFKVYGRGDIGLLFHCWLPLRGFIKNDTYFLRPNAETIITAPGNAQNIITATAYNHINNSLYLDASRGYSRVNIVKPELVAPGVDVYSPRLHNQFTSNTGTSIAAAQVTGICAMLLEWGILRGNYTSIGTTDIKKFLIRGARRSDNKSYPNKEWGYGIIDIYSTLDSLRGEIE